MREYFIISILLLTHLQIKAQDYFKYPQTNKAIQYDTIFGEVVYDPFRWMEEPSVEVNNWLEIQADLLSQYKRKELKHYSSVYNDLVTYSYVDFKPLIKQGSSFYFYKYNSYYSSPSLYQQRGYNTNNWSIVDIDKFEEKGERVSITNFKVSLDEKYLAFSLSRSGSDWREIRVKDIDKGKYLEDLIKWVKYSDIHWKGDGFFYWKYDTPEKGFELLEKVKNQQLYYHKVGTKQEEDELIFEIEEQEYFNSSFEVTSDKRYLIVYTFQKIHDEWKKVILIKDLELESQLENLLVCPNEDNNFSIIDHIGGKLYLTTDFEANNYRILSIDVKSKEIIEVIPEYDQLIEKANIISNKIVCLFYSEGKYLLAVFDLGGNPLVTDQFDEGFHVSGFDGNNDDEESLYFVRSFYFPTIVYRINFRENTIKLLSETKILYDHKQFETRYLKYESKDGTWIPMYLTYKKGIDLTSGINPVLLYGYGGFGVSLVPHYDPGYILFLKSGGVLATPQIRGGGELGTSWHEAGKILNKQNSFEDFISAAEFLIQCRITNPSKIAINGGSNGGLLVGAMITQRPELFKAAIPEMGVFDMLRFERFGIGYVHHEEYGSASDSLEFLNLLKYSPYHNISNEENYPATLVITADNDDRVPPLHSYKFASRLQETSNTIPYLLNLQTQAGHYGSSILQDKHYHEALKWSFIIENLGMKLK